MCDLLFFFWQEGNVIYLPDQIVSVSLGFCSCLCPYFALGFCQNHVNESEGMSKGSEV